MRIGRVVSNAELRIVAESSEGAGAYRKASDFLRKTVEGLTPHRRTVVRKARELPAAHDNASEKTSRARRHAKV